MCSWAVASMSASASPNAGCFFLLCCFMCAALVAVLLVIGCMCMCFSMNSCAFVKSICCWRNLSASSAMLSMLIALLLMRWRCFFGSVPLK